MARKDWTRSAWVENDWMHQGAGRRGDVWRASVKRRQVVEEARRAGDWVMLALLVIVWVGVVTAPLWMK